MTNPTFAQDDSARLTAGGFYRLVWKWHFLAALFVLPFMAMLSITGGLYLFKPQFENWYYSDYKYITPVEAQARLPMEDLLTALSAEDDVARLKGITEYDAPDRSVMIAYSDDARASKYAWINPYSGEVLATVEHKSMPMQLLRKFHGELLLGKFGTKFVELSAHWSIILFITGLYLWWPRGKRTLKEATSLPKGEGRSWWRQAHMFTGMLATLLIVPLLISGLPWTDIWGGSLSAIQKQTGQKSASLRFGPGAPNSTSDAGETLPIDTIFSIAKAEGLPAPYELRPPKNNEAAYWVRTAKRAAFEQEEIVVDQYSGEVLKRVVFADNPIIAKAVSLGIYFHQGELYGTLNLIQNVVAAILGVVLSVSGFVAWWMRRPAGQLGVPKAPEASLGRGMIALVVFLSVLFPLVGASLILALFLDWLIFRRLGWFGATRA